MKYLFLFIFCFNAHAYLTELKKLGKSKLELPFLGLDLCQIEYYQAQSSHAVRLIYLRDIKKSHSLLGWDKGLNQNLKSPQEYQEQINWIKDNTVDMQINDELIIKISTHQVELIKNGKLLASKKDEKLAQIILLPWIGENPVDSKVKSELLN